MNERPILFTPGNYQAILDGSKTQTRRIVKPEPVRVSGGVPYRNPAASLHGAPGSAIYRCPYGQRGDRLWVREGLERTSVGNRIQYRSDRAPLYDRREWTWQRNYLSPLHMPKWAARLWLEITDVRVERLQDCSEDDAKAEGAKFHDGGSVGHSGWRHDLKDVHSNARSSYARLWESINGAGSWDTNPFVWAITFKKGDPS